MYNLLPEYQSAYRKFHSWETSLLKLVSDYLWAMEQQQITAVLIMDLLAAFHTVNHDLLLDVLQWIFGITNTVLKWYKNLLKLRKLTICINSSYSSEQTMNFGLHQGSIQQYASRLSEIVPDSLTLNGFADDHSIRSTFKPEKRNTNKDNKRTIRRQHHYDHGKIHDGHQGLDGSCQT